MEEGCLSRACCWDEPGGEVVAAPLLWPSQSKVSVTTGFLWKGGTLRELGLAGFHLLSHAGGEVTGESQGARGSRRWKGLEQLLWGRKDSQTTDWLRALQCFVFGELTLQLLVISVHISVALRQKQEAGGVARAEIGPDK